ncbi:Crp/Fnr family transcriptional regulator [Aestuariibacter salexigens]|uniref:Crp/Fnr family transcriptional regulator n=1 Tax=Aestuariibacter salexigens TaxID=226010 RepID=UPI0004283E83|nr:Crp/Fnr family transcriptional regulator [Aestuariibacter salexigens]
MTISPFNALFAANPWFAQLPDKAVNDLVALCHTKQLKAGQQLHARHDEAEGLYAVLKGRIRISNVNSDGKEMVLTYLQVGTWFGEISLFDGLPRTHDAYAETDSQVLVLPTSAFHKLLKSHPELYPHFMKLLCQRIRAAFSIIDETSALSLRQQLARRLILLADNFGAQPLTASPQTVNVSQETLARMLNTSRQTVNKLLQEMKEECLIEIKYGRITINAPDRLQKEIEY